MAKRTASARKQMRATVGRTLRNKAVRSAVKTRVVKVRRAIAEHAEGLAELGVAAIASLDRAANKGILHRNNAARRKSRLMKALSTAGQAPAVAAPKPTKAKAKAKVAPAKAAKLRAKAKAVAAKPAAPAAKPAATKAKAPTGPAAKTAAKPAKAAAKAGKTAKPAKPVTKKR